MARTRSMRRTRKRSAKRGGAPAKAAAAKPAAAKPAAPPPVAITFTDADFRGGAGTIIKKLYDEGVKTWFNSLSTADAFRTRFPSGLQAFPGAPTATWAQIITAVTPK